MTPMRKNRIDPDTPLNGKSNSTLSTPASALRGKPGASNT
jgi:hypothetical protein